MQSHCPPIAPRRKVAAFVIGVLGISSMCHGTVLVSENFDTYVADGSLAGENGGYGWTTPWVGFAEAIDPSPLDGSLRAGRTPGTDQDSFRDFNAPLGANNTTCYISFLASVNQNDQYGGVSLFSGTTEQFFMGDTDFSGEWGFGDKFYTAHTSATTADSTPVLLVYRIDFGGANETVTMWIDPVSEASTPAIGPTTVPNFDTVGRIRISSGSTSEQLTVDNLVMADTFIEVIPEPSGTMLFAGSVLTLLMRRKRVS